MSNEIALVPRGLATVKRAAAGRVSAGGKSGRALLRFLHLHYSQQTHAAKLLQSRWPVLAVVRGPGLLDVAMGNRSTVPAISNGWCCRNRKGRGLAKASVKQPPRGAADAV
jgi:hypothetical protein